MPDDHGERKERLLKKLCSFNSFIPSEGFSTEGFFLWLEHASPTELEKDILTEKTSNLMQEETLAAYYRLIEEAPLEPDCEPKVEFQYLGPLKPTVKL